MLTLSSFSLQNEPQRGRDDPVCLFLPWRGSYLRASVEFSVSLETPLNHWACLTLAGLEQVGRGVCRRSSCPRPWPGWSVLWPVL